MTAEGQTIRFAPGELIFKEGDKGEFIFLIERGSVEIFIGEGTGVVILTEMGPTEMVGVMSAVTGQPRLASARAKTEVISKRIPSQAISDQVKELPNWVKAVFKDYHARLNNVNKLFHEQSRELRRLNKKMKAATEKDAASKKPGGASADPAAPSPEAEMIAAGVVATDDPSKK